MQEVKERPILFTGEMVRAILDGSKTQTRRVIKTVSGPHAENLESLFGYRLVWIPRRRTVIKLTDNGLVWNPVGGCDDEPWVDGAHDGMVACPYGIAGDRLWVRETWAQDDPDPEEYPAVVYRADRAARHAFQGRLIDLEDWYLPSTYEPARWRPSIHMPRWASRIDLEVTGVRVERLQSITEDDARAEGVVADMETWHKAFPDGPPPCFPWRPHQTAFAGLWRSINAKRAPWSSNPWCWVVEFKIARAVTNEQRMKEARKS